MLKCGLRAKFLEKNRMVFFSDRSLCTILAGSAEINERDVQEKRNQVPADITRR